MDIASASGTYHQESNFQLQRISVKFNEAMGNKYVPWAIMVDLELWILDFIPWVHLDRPEDRTILTLVSKVKNNWVKGYYT